MSEYQEALDILADNGTEHDELEKKCLRTLQELVDNYSTIEKALLLTCEKISFGEENDYESETQEEAQDNYIYKKYTRPKELMEKYIEKARKDI